MAVLCLLPIGVLLFGRLFRMLKITLHVQPIAHRNVFLLRSLDRRHGLRLDVPQRQLRCTQPRKWSEFVPAAGNCWLQGLRGQELCSIGGGGVVLGACFGTGVLPLPAPPPGFFEPGEDPGILLVAASLELSDLAPCPGNSPPVARNPRRRVALPIHPGELED